ncbi:MAG: imidazole glycerol phosphate synthase subunit HisH [Candidatus Lernaella stagnicola]|nr:imidazole glycerol phosphate synthase subunit HisH [Candidatus Lernaella stagnicola]
MTKPNVLVVRTGVANLASVLAGLERVGVTAQISNDPREIESAERVLLPGVGAFGAGMLQLRADRLVEPLRRRIAGNRATLAICLGMQLLCAASEEHPGMEGLGVVREHVTRFAHNLRVPQLGWNEIEPDKKCRMLESGYVYFANSYRLTERPPGWAVAVADYGGSFVAGMERGKVLACQFHPELSSAFGLALLRRWLATEEGDGDAGV